MLTDNNQIFRNCFVIIYCYLTKVSTQINKCIIFEPIALSLTLSILCGRTLLSLSIHIHQIYNCTVTIVIRQKLFLVTIGYTQLIHSTLCRWTCGADNDILPAIHEISHLRAKTLPGKNDIRSQFLTSL